MLNRRFGYYGVMIPLTIAAFGVGFAGLILVGNSWWALAIAAFLGLAFTQLGFVGHDAGHHEVFPLPPGEPAARARGRQRPHRDELRLVGPQAQRTSRPSERKPVGTRTWETPASSPWPLAARSWSRTGRLA